MDAAYITGFEAPAYNHSTDLAGQQSWSINDPTTTISYFSFWNGSWAGYLGGFYNAPTVAGVNLSQTYSAPVVGTVFDVDFRIVGSSASFPNRDSFGWTFKTGSGDLVRFAFEPTTVNLDRLEIVWYDNLNVRHTILPTSQDLFLDGDYHLKVSFNASGADSAFTAILSGTNSVSWSGTLPGTVGATLASFGADYDVYGAVPPSSAGDNFMVFDGVSLQSVPEPAGAVLALSACLALVSRRRR